MSINEKLFIASILGILVFGAFCLLALWADSIKNSLDNLPRTRRRKPMATYTKPRAERRPDAMTKAEEFDEAGKRG